MRPRRWADRERLQRLRTPGAIAGGLLLVMMLEVSGLAAVPIPAASVLMKALPANLSFGKAKEAQPSHQDVSAPEPVVDLLDLFNDPTEVNAAPVTAAPFCPEAGPTDFPDEPAGFDAKSPPAEGVYIWKQSGHIDFTAPFTFSVPLSPYTNQEIRNVRVADDGSWQYDYAWSTALVGTETDTIRVVPNSGIFLTHLHIQPEQQNAAPVDFTPITPVTLLTLPVTVNAEVGSPAPYVDVEHQRVMTFRGTVQKKARFDACGTMIEAWQITNGTRVMSSITNGPEDNSLPFDYAIAPHLGGLIVALHRAGSGNVAGLAYTYDATSSIGTLTPRKARP